MVAMIALRTSSQILIHWKMQMSHHCTCSHCIKTPNLNSSSRRPLELSLMSYYRLWTCCSRLSTLRHDFERFECDVCTLQLCMFSCMSFSELIAGNVTMRIITWYCSIAGSIRLHIGTGTLQDVRIAVKVQHGICAYS
jgi:hypothetical protein